MSVVKEEWVHPAPQYDRKYLKPDVNDTVLLVIDMQEHFRRIASPVLSSVVATVDHCKQIGLPIIFTQHGHKDESIDGGRLTEWWSNNIQYGSSDWQLLKELKGAASNCKKVEKIRYDAFERTDLLDTLKSLSVKTVAICGVMTNLCCETTARSAFNKDFNVLFLGDGCSTETLSMHNASLINLSYGFARVLSCHQFTKELDTTRSAP